MKLYMHPASITSRIVRLYAAEKGMLDTPRTTLVAAVMERGNMHWVHCGDSRLYLVRNGELLTRTRDHSYMEQQAHPCSCCRATVCCCARTGSGAR